MRRPLALLRPEPGWSASAATARAAGLAVVGNPLFEAEPVTWEMPRDDFDALLVGSAAAFRLGGAGLAGLVSLPVHAVGAATARAARAAGFAVARTGEGGLQALLDDAADQARHYLRLAGAERVALRPHPSQRLSEITVYRMAPRPIAPAFAEILAVEQPFVALHSAAAAAYFAAEIERLALPRRGLGLLALGPRIAEAAGSGWAAVHIAERPSDAALLAMARALCK